VESSRNVPVAFLAPSPIAVIGAPASEQELLPDMTEILPTSIASAGAAQGGGASAFIIGILPWILIFLIFYLLMIRPQHKRMKQHQAAIAAIKKGDEVITGGGIRGKVTKVADEEAEVEISNGVKVRVIKGTISQVLTPPAKPAND
jgi:preprotein translocase subunit YajC